VNPNTIVVLSTSLPVAMPWLANAKGVVQMWWPGDEGGPATANILLGRASPGGRLPITWPERLDQTVAQDPTGHPERTNQGVDGKTTYSEGIFVGYRWFDKQGLKPLFPFGYGLSYTTFQYSGLKVVRALVQFDRVTLAAGQSKPLTLRVEPRRLQYWSVAANRWTTATGPRTMYVGASSSDIRLQAEVNIAP
jgi:beta-glucosidase